MNSYFPNMCKFKVLLCEVCILSTISSASNASKRQKTLIQIQIVSNSNCIKRKWSCENRFLVHLEEQPKKLLFNDAHDYGLLEKLILWYSY